jgi:hypothetical protein
MVLGDCLTSQCSQMRDTYLSVTIEKFLCLIHEDPDLTYAMARHLSLRVFIKSRVL